MQNILRLSKSWRDPVSSLNRLITLILAVIAVETAAFYLRDTLPQFPPVYLLGMVRFADSLILLIFGPWSLKQTFLSETLKQSLMVTLFFLFAGFLFLIIWKNTIGTSLLKLDTVLFRQDNPAMIAFYMTSCLLSPLAEELVFRGLLYRKMREKWNPWLCAGIVSPVFALVHLYFTNQVLLPLLGGLIFCLGYEKTKSILTPLFLHTGGNLAIFLSPLMPFV
jgi:membrane protease YdiL (CAAX protease family)